MQRLFDTMLDTPLESNKVSATDPYTLTGKPSWWGERVYGVAMTAAALRKTKTPRENCAQFNFGLVTVVTNQLINYKVRVGVGRLTYDILFCVVFACVLPGYCSGSSLLLFLALNERLKMCFLGLNSLEASSIIVPD